MDKIKDEMVVNESDLMGIVVGKLTEIVDYVNAREAKKAKVMARLVKEFNKKNPGNPIKSILEDIS